MLKYLSFLTQVIQRQQSGSGPRSRRHFSRPKKKPFRPSLEALEDRRVPTTFVVNSLGDDNVGHGNTGDLRYVINRANADQAASPDKPDTIRFSGVAISQSNQTIRVGAGAAGNTPLPALTVPVVIDGTTVHGFDNLSGMLLTLDGSNLHGSANGLTLLGGYATVRGLEIVNFPGNGIQVQSSYNTIGGDEIGLDANRNPNNPAGFISTPLKDKGKGPLAFARPPQGNVISANAGDGIRIVNGADHNLLEGNFIGTDVTGLVAQGNHRNGVSIVKSDYNQVFGTTPPDQNNPFVFYNVISGNFHNGLVIDSSDHTEVYADFFGIGADDKTPVGNHLDGVLIEGTSDRTRFGLNIPLGNVSAANWGNGVEVKDSASRTLLMNTFDGVAAFNPSAQVPNLGDGLLITSDGGGNFYEGARFTTLVVTCQCSANDQNGIDIEGNAVGVQVSQSVVGMQTNGATPASNLQNGINIGGNASDIAIGGFEPSSLGGSEFPQGTFPVLEAANLISGNLGNGVAVGGNAQKVKIVNSFIGTQVDNTKAAANGQNGIFLDGVSGIQVGSPPGPNNARDRNIIAFNTLDGVLVSGGTGDSILGNSIFDNDGLGIDLVGGGNSNQPAPTLTSAQVASSGLLQVAGTLTAMPNTTYQIELFASQSNNPGNGQFFLGLVSVTTDDTGSAPFTFSGLTNLDSNGADFITATATSLGGDTSVFSTPIQVI